MTRWLGMKEAEENFNIQNSLILVLKSKYGLAFYQCPFTRGDPSSRQPFSAWLKIKKPWLSGFRMTRWLGMKEAEENFNIQNSLILVLKSRYGLAFYHWPFNRGDPSSRQPFSAWLKIKKTWLSGFRMTRSLGSGKGGKKRRAGTFAASRLR
jgi:hypothetical protein